MRWDSNRCKAGCQLRRIFRADVCFCNCKRNAGPPASLSKKGWKKTSAADRFRPLVLVLVSELMEFVAEPSWYDFSKANQNSFNKGRWIPGPSNGPWGHRSTRKPQQIRPFKTGFWDRPISGRGTKQVSPFRYQGLPTKPNGRVVPRPTDTGQASKKQRVGYQANAMESRRLGDGGRSGCKRRPLR